MGIASSSHAGTDRLASIRYKLGVFTLVVRAMRRCVFGVLAVAIFLAFFMLAPQGKELLSLVVEDATWSRYWFVWLIITTGALGVLVWYTSRVLMDFRDLSDAKIGGDQFRHFYDQLEIWFPRILGALCILPVVFFLADVGARTYVLTSPLLIVCVFSLLAAVDSHAGCLQCRLYRWGFLSSLLFVVAAHDWHNELPYDQEGSAAQFVQSLYKVNGDLSWATTGVQLLISIVSFALLDRACRSWLRSHADGILHEAKERKRAAVVLTAIGACAASAWMIMFMHTLAPRAHYVVPAVLFSAVLIVSLFVHRRDWFPKMFKMQPRAVVGAAGQSGATSGLAVKVEPITKIVLISVGIVGAGAFALIWAFPIPVGRSVGAPSLLMLALAIWVVFGSVVLTALPNAYRLPSFGIVPLIALSINAFFSEPITISKTPEDFRRAALGATKASLLPDSGSAPTAADSHGRLTVSENFKLWLKNPDTPADGPIFLAAAAGGGIRAAYLTASYLAAADDLTNGEFGRRLFAISGVSGGSLGAAVFAVARNEQPPKDCPYNIAIGSRQRVVACVLDADYLSPTVATFLFPDLLRTFWLPGNLYVHSWDDRGRTLEKAWTESLGKTRAADSFRDRFIRYAQPRDGLPAPINLILNGTRVQSGHRVIASTFTWRSLHAVDLFDPMYDTADVSFVGAVHNSARFTYVSPAGAYAFNEVKGSTFAGQVADGGYFDNSALLSLLEIIDELRADGDPAVSGALSRLRVVTITNDGRERRVCDTAPSRNDTDAYQLTAPLVTLLATRTARAELSKAQLRRALERPVGDDKHDRVVCNARSPLDPLIEVSLNDDVVACFLARDSHSKLAEKLCGQLPSSAIPARVSGEQETPRAPKSDKEIAVRVNEAPLGWTLSSDTTRWLSRFSRSKACELRAEFFRDVVADSAGCE